ncbi:MAG: DUF488 domain-containing protein [Halobacteriales archaeon]
MSENGTLFDTYVAALQHDLVDLPDGVATVGVVRRPTRWLHPYVDENLAALGPPEDLLDAFQTRHTALTEQGFEDPEAHNRAWEDVNYDQRYRTYLEESADAQTALDRLRTWLQEGRDVALVCYENTDDKRCHRTLLREYTGRQNC